MGRNRFANVTDVYRAELSDGDWIELKSELSVGDTQTNHFLLFTVDPVSSSQLDSDGKPKVGIRPREDTALVAELAVALVDWSFCDADGPVKLAATPLERAKQLRQLLPETLNEMRQAYQAYYNGPAAEEKKARSQSTIATS